jgi:hypothetical protein
MHLIHRNNESVVNLTVTFDLILNFEFQPLPIMSALICFYVAPSVNAVSSKKLRFKLYLAMNGKFDKPIALIVMRWQLYCMHLIISGN